MVQAVVSRTHGYHFWQDACESCTKRTKSFIECVVGSKVFDTLHRLRYSGIVLSDYERLIALLRDLGGAVIGYSGGVDSTLLAKAATDALGDRAICVLIESCLIPEAELAEAVSIAEDLGLNLVNIRADALAIEHVADNPPDRCYYCKRALFGKMLEIARERGLPFVLDGANADDESDFRPGTKATAELGVRSPLKELGLGKAEIRLISRELGLPTWSKPSYACLASRVPYGSTLTPEVLSRIERAEAFLHELGFGQCRVRDHADTARIELPDGDIARAAAPHTREAILGELKSLGYTYVSLDLAGYRTGSLNEILEQEANGF